MIPTRLKCFRNCWAHLSFAFRCTSLLRAASGFGLLCAITSVHWRYLPGAFRSAIISSNLLTLSYLFLVCRRLPESSTLAQRYAKSCALPRAFQLNLDWTSTAKPRSLNILRDGNHSRSTISATHALALTVLENWNKNKGVDSPTSTNSKLPIARKTLPWLPQFPVWGWAKLKPSVASTARDFKAQGIWQTKTVGLATGTGHPNVSNIAGSTSSVSRSISLEAAPVKEQDTELSRTQALVCNE